MLEDILGIVSSDLGVSFSTLGLESSSLNRSNLSIIFLWRLFCLRNFFIDSLHNRIAI
jgi:hypothetical protein